MTEETTEPPSYWQALEQLSKAVLESMVSPEVLAAIRAGGLPHVKASMNIDFGGVGTVKLTLQVELLDPADQPDE